MQKLTFAVVMGSSLLPKAVQAGFLTKWGNLFTLALYLGSVPGANSLPLGDPPQTSPQVAVQNETCPQRQNADFFFTCNPCPLSEDCSCPITTHQDQLWPKPTDLEQEGLLKEIPDPYLYEVFGNTKLEQAKVILMSENHSHPEHRSVALSLVQKWASEQKLLSPAVLLVEGNVYQEVDPLTRMGQQLGVIVNGWEGPDFQAHCPPGEESELIKIAGTKNIDSAQTKFKKFDQGCVLKRNEGALASIDKEVQKGRTVLILMGDAHIASTAAQPFLKEVFKRYPSLVYRPKGLGKIFSDSQEEFLSSYYQFRAVYLNNGAQSIEDVQQALEAIEPAIQLNPGCADHYMVKASILRNLRRDSESKQEVLNAIQLSPGHVKAIQKLEAYY